MIIKFLRRFFYLFIFLFVINFLIGLFLFYFSSDFSFFFDKVNQKGWFELTETFLYQYGLKFFVFDFGSDRFGHPVILMLGKHLDMSARLFFSLLFFSLLFAVFLFYWVFYGSHSWVRRIRCLFVFSAAFGLSVYFFDVLLGRSVDVGIWGEVWIVWLVLLTALVLFGKAWMDIGGIVEDLFGRLKISHLRYFGANSFQMVNRFFVFLLPSFLFYLFRLSFFAVLCVFLLEVFLELDGLGLYFYQGMFSMDVAVMHTLFFLSCLIFILFQNFRLNQNFFSVENLS